MKELIGVLVFSVIVTLLEYVSWRNGFSWAVFVLHIALVVYVVSKIGERK